MLLGGETDQNTHHKYNQGVANETNDEDDGKGNGDDIERQDPDHHLHGNSSSYAQCALHKIHLSIEYSLFEHTSTILIFE